MKKPFRYNKFKIEHLKYQFPVMLAGVNPYAHLDNVPEVLTKIEASSFIKDPFRILGNLILIGLAKMVDAVYSAIKAMLSFNFLNEIPAVREFSEKIPAIAWALFALCLIIGGIILMINSDKIKISDFAKSVLVSAMLIVGLPTFINAFDDLKNFGISDMDAMLVDNSADLTLGQKIIASLTIDVEESIDTAALTTMLSTIEANSAGDPYLVLGNEKLDPYDYTHKVELKVSTPNLPEIAAQAIYGMSLQEYQMRLLKAADPVTQAPGVFNIFSGFLGDDFLEKYTGAYSYVGLLKRVEANRKDNSSMEFYVQSILNAVQQPSSSSSDGETEDGEEVIITDDNTILSNEAAKLRLEEYDIEYDELLTKLTNSYSSTTHYNVIPLETGEYDIIGKISFLEEKLYAYQTDFLTALIMLLVVLIALVFAGFKIATLLYDLLFNQIIAPVVFASDLHNSGRSKKMVQNMVATYLMFIIILILMKLFMDVTYWIMGDAVINTGNMLSNALVKIFIIGGCAKGLIDGPDLIVSILGIDAGVKSGLGVIAGGAAAYSVAKGAAGTVKGVANTATAPARAAYSAYQNGNPISNASEQRHNRIMNSAQSKENWSNFKSQADSGGSAGGFSGGVSSSSHGGSPDGGSSYGGSLLAGRDLPPPSMTAQRGNSTARQAVEGREGSSMHGSSARSTSLGNAASSAPSGMQSSSVPQYHSPSSSSDSSSPSISSSGTYAQTSSVNKKNEASLPTVKGNPTPPAEATPKRR